MRKENTTDTLKQTLVVFFLILRPFSANYLMGSAITYSFDGSGRFGDCVIVYCKAKYCALIHNLPLLYRPFPHSESLQLHTQEIPFTNDWNKLLPNKKLVSSADEIDPTNEKTLFITDLFTMFAGEQPTDPTALIIPIPYWMNFWPDEIYAAMQANPLYKQEIQRMLSPAKNPPLLQIPNGTISIAVHIRKGGSFDFPLCSPQLYDKNNAQSYKEQYAGSPSDKKFPLRFPPEQFYVDQLNFLASLLNKHQLSVLLFTDDNNPQMLFIRLQEQCRAPNIHFIGIYYSQNFIDDLMLMAQTDCLIRPCSHFSGVAQLIGNHKIIIRPNQFVWQGPLLIISETTATLHNQATTESVSFTPTSEALKDKINALFCPTGISNE